MYERLEQLAQRPATRICAPFVLGGLLMLAALAGDTARALQAGGLISMLATLVLIREAGMFARPDVGEVLAVRRHLYGAALHASMFAISFLMASLAMALSL